MANTKRANTRTLTGLAILTALVVVLQVLAVAVPIQPFTLTLVLVPMVVGAALYGWWAGAWLGFVFGVVVLLTNAGAFLAVSVPGTILTCILKGVAAGAVSGLVYKLVAKIDESLATTIAAIISPIVNTGVFVLGCLVFFMPTIKEWAVDAKIENVYSFLFLTMIGANFILEMAINVVFAPTIVRIVKLVRQKKIAQ